MTTPSPSRLTHEPALDGLRAVAALAVLAWHDWRPWASGGSLGVDVFFVLSGYLITSIVWREIQETGNVDLAAFMKRRARRLLPGLLVMLAIYIAVSPWLLPRFSADRWSDGLFAGLYLMNLVQALAPHDSPLMHTWSLAGEVQFYLAFPLALACLARLPQRRAALALLAAWAALTLARLAWTQFGGSDSVAYYSPLFHSSGLVLGSAISLLRPKIRLGRAGLVAIAALIVAGGTRMGGSYHLVTPLAEVATALVVLDPPRLLAWRPLELTGRTSYGIYLWHLPLFFILGGGLRSNPPILLLAASSIVAAAASYLLVERHFLRRERSRSKTVTAAA